MEDSQPYAGPLHPISFSLSAAVTPWAAPTESAEKSAWPELAHERGTYRDPAHQPSAVPRRLPSTTAPIAAAPIDAISTAALATSSAAPIFGRFSVVIS